MTTTRRARRRHLRRSYAISAVACMLGCLWLTFKLHIAPEIARFILENWGERYGVRIDVAEWSIDLYDLQAEAGELRIRADDKFNYDHVLSAEALSLDAGYDYGLSDWLALAPIRDAWRDFRGGKLQDLRIRLNEVHLRNPEIRLERWIAGDASWLPLLRLLRAEGSSLHDRFTHHPDADAFQAAVQPALVPLNRDRTNAKYWLPTLRATGVKVVWTEQLPGESSGGIVRNIEETLNLDDGELDVFELYAPMDPGLMDTRFSFACRMGSGKLQATGNGNLSAARTRLLMNVYVENIGANALNWMVPKGAILPQSGFLTGKFEIEVRKGRLEARGLVDLQEVKYSANASSPLTEGIYERVARELHDESVTRRVEVEFDGNLEDPNFRTFAAAQQAITAEAVRETAPTAHVVARSDYERIALALSDEAGERLHRALLKELGAGTSRAIGDAASRTLATTLAGEETPEVGAGPREDPVGHALKRLGQGVRGLFRPRQDD